MRTVNIHEAKTHLSQLVEKAAHGESFVIAKAGKPLVKVVSLGAPSHGAIKRIGFMCGEISVPEDFDRMGSHEIQQLFSGDE
jgi:prevent-host-death family protein